MSGDPVVDPALRSAILSCIEQGGGPIFGHYKTNSLDRRLAARFEALGLASGDEYLARLQAEAAERHALVEALLVGVTSFFRDPPVFEALRNHVVEPLLRVAEGAPIRVWSVACCTGQEPYSLAILFAETAEAMERSLRLHIFATDLSSRALAVASQGVYDEEALAGLSAARRERWFLPAGAGCWKVRDELRKMITFASHDVTRDPAFPRMDLVCARNLLIYLNQEGQDRALQLFHFALLPGGMLAVGESELSSGHRQLFLPLPGVPGLLRRQATAPAFPGGGLPPRSGDKPTTPERKPALERKGTYVGERLPEPTELLEAWFRQRGGSGFLLDDRERVVFAFGEIWRYFPPPQGGLAHFTLRDLPDETLRICLREAIRQAGESGEVQRFALPDGSGGAPLPGRVEPFILASGESGYLLVLETGVHARPFAPQRLDLAETTRAYLGHLELRGAHLEAELQEQAALRGDGEERLKAANEELHASNEELLSINEELRATGEELREKVGELTVAKRTIEEDHARLAMAAAERTAILDHLQEGVIYLTPDFRCQWANAAALRIGSVQAEDLRDRHCYEALFGGTQVCPGCPVLDVLRTGESHERPVEVMPNGRTMHLSASPVRDGDGRLVGIVEHFHDITDERTLRRDLAERERLFRGIYETSPLAILVFDREGRLEHANPAALDMFGAAGDLPELQRLRLFEHWRLNEPRRERVRAGKPVRFHFDLDFGAARGSGLYRTTRGDRARLDMAITPLRFEGEGSPIVGYLAQIEEITQLQRAEEFWRLALDGVGDGVWDRNPRTGEAKWSASWYRMIGLEPDEIPSTYANLCALMHPDDLPGAQAIIEQCMAGHADTYRAEFRLRHKDGHWVWILSRGRVMERDEQGRPTRFAGTQIDISARKATEELLARRERDFQEILEGTSPVTGEELFECLTLHLARVLGLDYCFVSEPDAADPSGQARMVTFRGPVGMLEPYCYPLAESASARVFQGEIICCQDGATRQFPRDEKLTRLGVRGYVAVPLRIGGGEILGVMAGMAMHPLDDMDFVVRVFRIFAARAAAELEQRRALAELRKSEKRLRQIIQNMPILVAAHDEAGRFRFWNAECERVSGYPAKEIVGNPDAARLLWETPDVLPGLADYRNRESVLRSRDGGQHTILWSNLSSRCPIPGWAAWAIGIDITEQRKLEDGIRRAQKMSAVGELAAGVAHDFNNILHVILGNNELLLHERTDDPDLHRTCHSIQQAATRGADLVRQLMCLGRNDAFHPESHDLNELVAQSLAMLRRGVGPTVDIAFVSASKACGAKVDSGQVGQVLLNLCINARDAMRGKNGHIRIRLRHAELAGDEAESCRLEAGHYMVIDVADTGTGIPAEVQAKIFEPFFTTKEKTQGSGLGLASAYAIMQRHGGAIAFDTVPGQGTTFHLFFPAAALPVQIAPPTTAVTAGFPAQPLAGRTILVAEDEQMVLNLTARTLRRAGATVIAARDGAEAVELFRQHAGEVDALLFDAMMPRLNGGQAYLAIRELNPSVPALFASGYSADILKQGALEGLNLEVVQKPCPPGLLVTKLAALLQNQMGKDEV